MEEYETQFKEVKNINFIETNCQNCKYFDHFFDNRLYCKKHYSGTFSMIIDDLNSFKCGKYKPNKQKLEEIKLTKKNFKTTRKTF